MNSIKNISIAWIIHIFAVLHGVLAFSCRILGYGDEMALTMLTIAMAVIICFKKHVVVEFFAVSVIAVNVLGYVLGMVGADALSRVISSGIAVHALSTVLTTEILGWSITWLSKFFKRDEDRSSINYIRYIIVGACGILALRYVIGSIFATRNVTADQLFDVVHGVLNNSVSLVLLLCADVLYIHYIYSFSRKWKLGLRLSILIVFLCGLSFLEALIVNVEAEFFLRYVVSLLANILLFSLVYLVHYVQMSRTQMVEARERANLAQYRYIKLKRQVNPHFLFNSLNILDCLICEEKNEQASLYTHKLAGVYRYLIKSEERDLVTLREELEFVEGYVDLLKVRFPEGFTVNYKVREDDKSKMILPCAIQLLIENATKHNSIRADEPLMIEISSDGDYLQVRNNIVPKVSSSPSTGLGHKYIRGQYLDLCGKNVEIISSQTAYCVKLPLL